MKTKHWIIFITLEYLEFIPSSLDQDRHPRDGTDDSGCLSVLFGLLFGIAVILIQREKMPRTLKAWTPLLVLGLTNVAIPFFLSISWGEKRSTRVSLPF
ncbi:MAG: hypothetical protein IPJ46_22725 [Anaerolineales bacterium]|nr:hypothetical protein [Anaerolineales bacterium]